MNPENRELLYRLELATSRSSPPDEILDAETALLREQWLVLRRLLEANERGVARAFSGELALDAKAVAEQAQVGSEHVTLAWQSLPARRRRGGWLVAASCCLPVAVWLALVLFSTGSGETFRSQESALLPRPVAGATPRVETPPAGNVSLAGSEKEAGWEPVWDDDWESSMARTSLAVQQYRSRLAPDPAWARLQDAFQELAREVESGAL